MKIDVVISAKYIEEENLRGKAAVIIDTLRATSTITTALNNGAKEVIPVLTIEEAIAIREKYRDRSFRRRKKVKFLK